MLIKVLYRAATREASHLVCVRRRAAHPLDGGKDWAEHVCSVIGDLVLENAGDSLHPHARVHVLGRQQLQGGIRLPVVLQRECGRRSADAGHVLSQAMKEAGRPT